MTIRLVTSIVLFLCLAACKSASHKGGYGTADRSQIKNISATPLSLSQFDQCRFVDQCVALTAKEIDIHIQQFMQRMPEQSQKVSAVASAIAQNRSLLEGTHQWQNYFCGDSNR